MREEDGRLRGDQLSMVQHRSIQGAWQSYLPGHSERGGMLGNLKRDVEKLGLDRLGECAAPAQPC